MGYLLFAFIVAVIATHLNRNGFGWFVFALILTPILVGIVLLIMGKHDDPTVNPTRLRTRKIRRTVRW